MPGRDQTGPMGQGAMTGRGAGLCAVSETAAKEAFGLRRGRGACRRFFSRGLGLGFGRGLGGVSRGVDDPQGEKEGLLARMDDLKRELDTLKTRMEKIKE